MLFEAASMRGLRAIEGARSKETESERPSSLGLGYAEVAVGQWAAPGKDSWRHAPGPPDPGKLLFVCHREFSCVGCAPT